MFDRIKDWFDDIGSQGQLFFIMCIQTFVFVIVVNLNLFGIW